MLCCALLLFLPGPNPGPTRTPATSVSSVPLLGCLSLMELALFSPSSSSSAHPPSPAICSEPMDLALKSYFGFSSLRPYQKEVIDKIFEGRDCLVVMATGAGKSLCYQLPPVVSKKTAIVVSPLLSLMQDQVMSLKQKGISSDYLGSTQSNKSVPTNAQNGLYDVLFLTPEKARSLPNRFWTKINEHGVCLFAVDEAHCISEWGPDFRPAYKILNELRVKLPGVPCVALTATATARVRDDIITSLDLSQPHECIGSFDRPNLFYSVKLMKGRPCVSTFLDLVIKDVQRRFIAGESTIIYCTTIRDTEDVHDALTAKGVLCGMYHGQMDRLSREQSHKSFITDKLLVMVATLAFGMGIDKPDVRCVIHYGCPKSLESYYQESGRCGRDGLPSSCFLYYSRTDFCKGDYYCSDTMTEDQKTAIMNSYIAAQKYCMLGTCRRRDLLNYFGEDSPSHCGNCDNCNNAAIIQKDLHDEAVLLTSSIKQCGSRWGLNMPIDVLRGSNANKILGMNFDALPIHGKGKSRTADWWKCLASILISNGFLEDTPSGSHRVVRVTSKGDDLIQGTLPGPRSLIFTLPQEMVDEEKDETPEHDSCVNADDPPMQSQFSNNAELELYQVLAKVRLMLAKDSSTAPYVICGDQVLRSIARSRPSNKGTLSLVEGVNTVFIDRFSAIFIHHVKETCEELNLALDNFDLDGFDSPLGSTVGQSPEGPVSEEEMIEKLRTIISSEPSGVPLDDIVQSFPAEMKQSVIQTLEVLENKIEIWSRDNIYFPL